MTSPVVQRALAPPAASGPLPRSGLILLFALSFGWGLNWPVIKFTMTEIPVWNFRTICLIGGAVGMTALAAASGQRLRLRREEIRPLLICTLFNMIGWHLLAGYGILLIEAGRAAIIGYTMPLWAAVLGAWVLREHLRRSAVLGLFLGLCGIALLLTDDLAAFSRSPVGTLAMMGGAFCWAFGTVLTKRFALTLPTFSFTAWQCALATPVIALGAVTLEGPVDLGGLSLGVWAALFYGIVVGMLFCYWAWYSVIRIFPAVIASIGTLAIPVVGLLSSALLLGEPLGWRQFGALALVMAGLAVVLVLPAMRGPSPPPDAAAR